MACCNRDVEFRIEGILMKRDAVIRDALGFDDVALVPAETNVRPQEVSLQTRLTKGITLNIPLISAGRDNVTESVMAIAMARLGGIGVIHNNMPLGKQVEEVRRVKRAEGDMVLNPITISPGASVAEAIDLMTTYKVSGLPVVEDGTQKVVGILTHRDVRFFEDYAKPVSELMTKDVITVRNKPEKSAAMHMLHEHRIEKLVVVDDQGKCVGLVTVKDIERQARHVNATRDAHGRLRVGAAVSLSKDAIERSAAMADAGLDVVFVDVAHAHSREAVGIVSRIRQQRATDIQVVAGNVTSGAAARSLIDAGADAVKFGPPCGAGRIGFDAPHFSALLDVVNQCAMVGVPVIVEGGIRCPASLAKALAAGAESASLVSVLAATDEAPGDIVFVDGEAYKTERPRAQGLPHPDPYKIEGVPDASARYRGPMAHGVEHLLSGLKTAMAYAGAKDIKSLAENAQFVRAAK
jgi:IMP dehydrogenase